MRHILVTSLLALGLNGLSLTPASVAQAAVRKPAQHQKDSSAVTGDDIGLEGEDEEVLEVEEPLAEEQPTADDVDEELAEGELPADDVANTPSAPADDEVEDETNDSTGDIAKEIVKESESPEPEFPYPGATEEGFDDVPATQLEAQGPAPGLIRPLRISSSGEYFYGYKSSGKDAAASVRIGFFSPPSIENPESRAKFEDIYGSQTVPTLFGDYEWTLTRALGDLGLKAGSGLFIRQGEGQFAVEDPERANRKPEEKFTFIMFPNTISAIYRFQYAEKQPIVPYAEGGGGYFTFAEIRDDGAKPKFGAAPVLFGAGGLNFLLDWLDPQSIRQLDQEWGINHVWLTTEFRYIAGLNEQYDFSSTVINAGIMMEF